MATGSVNLFFAFFLVVACALGVRAHQKYANFLLKVVPAFPKEGGRTCEGIGHIDCPGDDDVNQFGDDFANAGYAWTFDFCKMDSDNDGLSNGDELGDGCCTLKKSGPLTRTTDISNPGTRSSTNRLASCRFKDTATPTSGSVTALSGAQKILLNVNYPALTTACVCTATLNVVLVTPTLRSTHTVSIYRSTTEILLPIAGESMPTAEATSIEITPTFTNLKGSKQGVTITLPIDHATASVDSKSPTALPVISSSPPTAAFMTNNKYNPFIPLAMFLTAGLIICAIGICLQFLPHTSGPKRALEKQLYVPSSVTSTKYLSPFAGMSVGTHISVFFMYVVIIIGTVVWGLHDHHDNQFPYDTSIYRAMGHLATFFFGLTLLVSTRRLPIWHWVFGLSFERQIMMHILFALPVVIFSLIHGISLVIPAFESGNISTQDIFGIISGALLVLIYLSSWFRHWFYAFFRIIHCMAPLAALAGMVHVLLASYKPSQIEGGVIIVPLILLVLDVFWRVGSDVVQPATICKEASPKCIDGFAYLPLEKKGFKWQPGQWVSLTVPSISLVSHPFTMMPSLSNNTEKRPDPSRFDLLIKTQGSSSFTNQLHKALSSPNVKKQPLVQLTGPYGEGAKAAALSDKIILVAGGSGVSGVVSMLAGIAPEKVSRVVWCLRDLELLDLLRPHFDAVPESKRRFFLTSGGQKKNAVGDKDMERSSLAADISIGRPNIPEVLSEALREADSEGAKTMSVLVCAPDALMMDVWRFSNKTAKSTAPKMQVRLHLEAFKF